MINQTIQEYINQKLKDEEWGDHIEIQAASNLYNRPIIIIQKKGIQISVHIFQKNEMITTNDINALNSYKNPILLFYKSGNHCQPIIKIDGNFKFFLN